MHAAPQVLVSGSLAFSVLEMSTIDNEILTKDPGENSEATQSSGVTKDEKHQRR